MKKLLVVGGLVLAVFIVAFSVIDLVLVVAMAIPAQAAEIGFCQNNKTGVATFAPSSGKCPKGATLVQINSAGVPGPQGPPGPPGAKNGSCDTVCGSGCSRWTLWALWPRCACRSCRSSVPFGSLWPLWTGYPGTVDLHECGAFGTFP